MYIRDFPIKAALSVIFLLHLLTGCSDRQSGLINDVVDRYDINTSRRECSQVNFHRNSLNKKNLLLGMKCLGFDKKYARIESVLIESSTEQFDTIMRPFNEAFFSGTDARSTAIDFFSKELNDETKAEIQSIILELPAFIDRFQFFAKLRGLHDQGEDFFLDKKIIKNLNDYYALSSKTSQSRAEVGTFLASLDEKKKASLQLFSSEALANMLNSDNREQFKRFLIHLSLLTDKGKLAPEEVQKLMSFIASLSDQDFRTLESIKSLASGEKKLSCGSESTLNIDVRREFLDQISALERSDLIFYNKLSSLFIKLRLLEELCQNSEQTKLFKHGIGLVGEFFEHRGSTDLARAFVKSTPNKLEIFDFIGGSFFREIKSFLNALSHKELGDLSLALSNYLGAFDEDARKSCLAGVDLLANKKLHNILSALSSQEGFSDYFLINFMAHKGALETSDLVLKMFDKWPKLSSSVETVFMDPSALDLLVELEQKMGNDALIKNIQDFVSSEDMSRLFSLFLAKKAVKKNEAEESPGNSKFSAITIQVGNKELALDCLKELTESVDTKGIPELYESYSDSCKAALKEDMSSHLLVYAAQSNSAFKRLFGKELFIGSGVFSPELLNLYVSALVLWADTAEIHNSEELAKELDLIRTSLLGADFIESSLKTLEFVADSQSAQESLSGALLYMTQMEESELRALLINTFSPYSGRRHVLVPLATVASHRATGLKNETPFGEVESKKRVAENLLAFIDPRIGTNLAGGIYHFDLKEALLFIYDLTDPRFVENVYHYTSGADVAFIPMHLSERIETTIWEISFLNNFYGAYFVNRIAMAENYLLEVTKLKKYIRTLDVSEGLFRRLGVYPKKTLWAFKNIYNTYDSLEELGVQKFGPEKRSYERPTQALLKRIVLSSPEASRNFSPYRRPNIELVQGHAGILLAKLVNQGLLTKFSLFLRENYRPQFSKRLETDSFIELEKRFMSLEFYKLRPLILELLEKKIFYTLSDEFLGRFMALGSHKQEQVISRAIDIIESFLSLPVEDHHAFLKLLNTILPDVQLEKKIQLPQLMGEAAKFAGLLSEAPGLLTAIYGGVNKILVGREGTNFTLSHIDLENETIRTIISHPQFPTQSIIKALKRHYDKHQNFEYFFQVLKLLTDTVESEHFGPRESRLELALRTILKEDKSKLERFLMDLINKISVTSDFTLSK